MLVLEIIFSYYMSRTLRGVLSHYDEITEKL